MLPPDGYATVLARYPCPIERWVGIPRDISMPVRPMLLPGGYAAVPAGYPCPSSARCVGRGLLQPLAAAGVYLPPFCTRWSGIVNILAEMRELSIPRDSMTYGASIFAQARGHQWESALCTFEEMKQLSFDRAGVRPECSTYHQVFAACNVEGNWARALTLWFEMQDAQIAPTFETYTALLRVAETCQRWEWSRQLLDTLNLQGAPRNTEMYNAAINACRRGKRWDLALQLLREMQDSDVPRDVSTYSYLTDLFEKVGRLDDAKALMSLENYGAQGAQ
ncbi:unnamed protein product [Prorocentrum cordatum]|uniref:Pentacotripeptide-repeat region of PRORP domain-containing protein n=1 Tax=Prorocentrum cordatum TaxID=2364126 RepID=A0ABN9WCG8_9DINO|nr:unnamed protein product [Polarella glacialis]